MSPRWPQRELDGVIADIYKATTEPEGWNAVIERLARRIDASIAAIHVYAQSGDREASATLGSWGAEALPAVRKYHSYYVTRNAWLIHRPHLLKAGAILTGEELCPDNVLLRSEFYLDFLRPIDVRYSILAVLTGDPDAPAHFFAGRSHRSRPFGEVERAVVGAVAPHLIQAIQIQSRIEVVQAKRQAVSGAMERLPLAVIFLDKRCRVVEMNTSARKILEAGDGLRLERGVLMAIDTRAEVQLQQMIFGAAKVDSGRFLLHGGALSIPRPLGGRPLSAMVAPTGVTGIFPASRAASVVVLIQEPDRRSAAPFDVFTSAHGLSRAEAGLVSRLVGGTSLRQAAADLGISDNTARTHLKHVFAKTGARRQADLVRRVLTHEIGDGQKSN